MSIYELAERDLRKAENSLAMAKKRPNVPAAELEHIENLCRLRKEILEIIRNTHNKQSEWISVDERLPEVGGTYLIALKEKYEWEKEWRYHVDAASFTFEWDCIFHDWDEGQDIHITHWMPLPEAPKMKGGAE